MSTSSSCTAVAADIGARSQFVGLTGAAVLALLITTDPEPSVRAGLLIVLGLALLAVNSWLGRRAQAASDACAREANCGLAVAACGTMLMAGSVWRRSVGG